MNRDHMRGPLLSRPWADDGFGNLIFNTNFEQVWYFITGEIW